MLVLDGHCGGANARGVRADTRAVVVVSALAAVTIVAAGLTGDPRASGVPVVPAPLAGGGTFAQEGSDGAIHARVEVARRAYSTVPVVVEQTELHVEAAPPLGASGSPATPRDLPPANDRAVDPLNEPVVADAEASATAGRVETDPIEVSAVQTIGVTWPAEVDAEGLDLHVRTLVDGEWSEWEALESDVSPDSGTAEADNVRGGTEALAVPDADAVQLSFAASTAGGPDGMRLALVVPDADASASDQAPVVSTMPAAYVRVASASSSLPSASAPALISRAAWGARPPVCTPDVASTILAAVVHHTAGPNSYSTVTQAMQQIRNDQAYHIDGRGWCDIGYNFIVDKWGNIYEGRVGSADAPVIGVHAGGFNTATVGISMLGDYSTLSPPAAAQESVARVIAWRLGAYYRDPASTISYTTPGGENSIYPAGTSLALPTIIGHRDVANTACPGQAGYATLEWLRARARQLIGAGWVSPELSSTTPPMGASVVVRGATLGGPLDWQLQVVDERTGYAMSTSTGTIDQPGGGLLAQWDGLGPTGLPVGPGPYQLRLTGSNPSTGSAAVPWVGHVDVVGSQNPPVVAPAPLVGSLTLVPITPQRLLDTRPAGQSLGPASRLDLTVAGVAGVPADAKAVALNVTAVGATEVTFIRAWPAGAAAPPSSLLNAAPGRTAAAAGVTAVGGGGKVSLSNDAGSLHLVVDVTGYYTDAAASGASFEPLPRAARLLDTRGDAGIASGTTRPLVVAGTAGVPANATAVVLNVVSTRSTGPGYVSVVPHGADARATSTVNHLVGLDVANRATVPLAGGAVDVHVEGGSADVVVDVVGWYGPSGSLRLTPISAARVLDTRSGSPIGARQSKVFSVAGVAASLPGARAAIGTITATRQTASTTYLTIWPAGTPQPPTSDINTGAGRDQANMAVLTWNSAGDAAAYNDQGSTHLVVDVYALFG